ncbi:MAG: 2Fe-2S iron-sulfur cluster-binding protein, partial [Chloroflexota bacterium]
MSGFRLPHPHGTLIDRASPLRFTFNGRSLDGFRGDTLASALLANGVCRVGRSYKFHRPRGIFSCGPEEPTGIVEIGAGSRLTPNTKTTQIALTEGLQARSGSGWPSLALDLAAINDRLAALIPAGFYYKTFIWPSWHLFEPFIRNLAAPSLPAEAPDPDRYDVLHTEADILVIGGGASGSTAALSAAQAGARVVLIHSGPVMQGAALSRAGVQVLMHTVACGVYDHL